MIAELKPTSRENWRTVRFDEMAQLVNDRVDNPAESGVEFYVGLEHLDSESLKIRRWGKPTDVEAQKLRFKPGDIIFGKRRAYQRKVAVAEFEGICSAHAMVLRAREENIVKDFLPFFMQSDAFFDVALSISVGSLSPTINWKTLAEQKFTIPPKDEQNQISSLLNSFEDVIEATLKTINSLRLVHKAIINEICDVSFESNSMKKLKEVCIGNSKYGANAPAINFLLDSPRFVRITDIDEFGNLNEEDLVSLKVENLEEYILKDGDFLFARTGNTVGKTYLYKSLDGYCAFAGYLIRFRLDSEKLLPEFLLHFTHSAIYYDWVKNTVRTGAQPNINAVEYSNMLIPMPTIEVQEIAVEKLTAIEEAIKNQLNYLKLTRQTKKEFIDKNLKAT